jgi:hypothetical protein
MRTIKFRAWDLINRRWCGYDLKGFVFTDRATKEQEIIEWCPKRDGKILMQFTGLKDKRGCEIYEGDLVQVIQKGKYRDGKPYKVEWKMDKLRNGWNVSRGINLEVVGNIYEGLETRLLKRVCCHGEPVCLKCITEKCWCTKIK